MVPNFNSKESKTVLGKAIMEILVNFNLGHDGSWDGVEECMKDILLAIDSSYTSKLKVLEGALEYFVSWFEKFKAKQSRLLIEGQTLESASANCDEATSMDDDPLDFSVATQALAGVRGEG